MRGSLSGGWPVRGEVSAALASVTCSAKPVWAESVLDAAEVGGAWGGVSSRDGLQPANWQSAAVVAITSVTVGPILIELSLSIIAG